MRRVVLASLLAVGACGYPPLPPIGGDDAAAPDGLPDRGFEKPTSAVHANMETSPGNWVDLGLADLSCLETPPTDVPTTTAITLNSVVEDFETGGPVQDATVSAFMGLDFTSPFDAQTSSASGMVTVTIPSGTDRFGFKTTTASGSTMPTFLLNEYLGDGTTTPQTLSEVTSFSQATAQALPTLIGIARTAGTGLVGGVAHDCQRHELSSFVATVSTTEGTATMLAGADAYYLSPSNDLPVPHCASGGCGSTELDAASANGGFLIIQLAPSASAYLQIWGYPTDGDVGGALTLIGELQLPVLADTAMLVSLDPLR